MNRGKSMVNSAVLQQVAEQSDRVYFIYAPEDKRLCYLNLAFKEVWGVDQEKALDDFSVLLSMVHEEDTQFVRQQYQDFLKDRQRKQIEFRITLPDHTIKWISLTGYPIPVDISEGFLLAGHAEDITQTKEYMLNALKFAAKKNSVLEILSHDLAAPFTTIQGMVDLIERKLKKGEDITEYLEYIKDNAKRGTNLIRSFVDNEFLESSQVKLTKIRVDLTERIAYFMEDYTQGEELIAKNFEYITPEQPIYVEVDEVKFMQVINNLISNAIKFTPDHGKIKVQVEDKGESVLISVSDNGIGIPKELQPNLFDKFTKARRPGLRGEQSVGLGMSIIKNIVELHKGRIWFESEENKGATFFIHIPK